MHNQSFEKRRGREPVRRDRGYDVRERRRSRKGNPLHYFQIRCYLLPKETRRTVNRGPANEQLEQSGVRDPLR